MRNPIRDTRLYRALRTRVLGTITHVRTDANAVALTFDDGPDPDFTPQLLELLKQYNARATFFVVGERAAGNPELVDQMVREGHLLGNHSWSHRALPLLERNERLKEMKLCHRAIPKQRMRVLRPPYGYQNVQSRLDAFRLGYHVVAWNAAGDDCNGADSDAIADRLVRETRPGSIILMHDSLFKTLDPGYRDRRPMLEALARILPELSKVYQFVTVGELMKLGTPHRELWWRRPDARMLGKLV
jgi:peptidoglycan-N-acetylglucosamine deacetylase